MSEVQGTSKAMHKIKKRASSTPGKPHSKKGKRIAEELTRNEAVVRGLIAQMGEQLPASIGEVPLRAFHASISELEKILDVEKLDHSEANSAIQPVSIHPIQGPATTSFQTAMQSSSTAVDAIEPASTDQPTQMQRRPKPGQQTRDQEHAKLKDLKALLSESFRPTIGESWKKMKESLRLRLKKRDMNTLLGIMRESKASFETALQLEQQQLTNERLLSLTEDTSKNSRNIYDIWNNQAKNYDAIMSVNRDLVREGLADNNGPIDEAGETASDKGTKEEAVEEGVAEEEGVEGLAYNESENPAREAADTQERGVRTTDIKAIVTGMNELQQLLKAHLLLANDLTPTPSIEGLSTTAQSTPLLQRHLNAVQVSPEGSNPSERLAHPTQPDIGCTPDSRRDRYLEGRTTATRPIEQTMSQEPSPGNTMSGALQMTQQAADGVSANTKGMMTPVEAGIFAGIAGAVGAGGLIVKSFDAHSNTKTADAAVETAKANTKTSNANEMSARADVMNVGIAAKKLEFEIKQAEDKARNECKDQGPRPSSGSSNGGGKPSAPGIQPSAASSSSTKDQKADKLPTDPLGPPLKRSSTSPDITQSTGKGGLPKLDSVTALETLLMEQQRKDNVSKKNAIWVKTQEWSRRREDELHNNVHHLVDEETNRRSLELNYSSVASSKKQRGKGKGRGIAIELNNLIPQDLNPTQPPDSDIYIAAVPQADEAESSGSSNNQAEERNLPNPDSGAHSKSLEEAHDRDSNIAEPQSEDPHGSSGAAHDLEKPNECLAAPEADDDEVEHATGDVPTQARVLSENTKALSDNAPIEDPHATVEEEQSVSNPVVRVH